MLSLVALCKKQLVCQNVAYILGNNMSWDAILVKTSDTNFAKPADNATGISMGKPAELRGKINSVIPGIHWWNGTEGNANMGSLSLEFSLIGNEKVNFPVVTAAQIPKPPGELDDVGSIGVSARGAGDPVSILVTIAKANHWSLGDSQDGSWIDLNSPSQSSWQEFTGYRDHVVNNLEGARTNGGTNSTLSIGVNLIISAVIFAALIFLVRKATR